MKKEAFLEKFLKTHSAKITFLGFLFILWCFYSVVHQGGSIIPRIQRLEYYEKDFRRLEPLLYHYMSHTHRYYDGKVNP